MSRIPHPELIARAVYGLTELYRDAIAGADLVACPGCFPTAAILALAPLADAGLIADVVIDAKTGVSGAGKAPTETTPLRRRSTRTCGAYGVGGHRHMPEIDQELAALGAPVPITFIPHLVPLDQGELAVLLRHADAARDRRRARRRSTRPATRASRSSSSSSARPACATCARPTSARSASTPTSAPASCSCSRSIDNLWKGTASQAIANLNLMFGLPEEAGLR